jgi:hypothetical protein
MTELDLYRYINDYNIEWHRQDNDGTPDIIIFPYIFQMEDFAKIVKDYSGDGGLECRLMGNYFSFWVQDLCDYYGIDTNKVFCNGTT